LADDSIVVAVVADAAVVDADSSSLVAVSSDEEEDDEDEDDDEDVAADVAVLVVAVVADFVDFISCSNEVPASATARAQHATVNRSIVFGVAAERVNFPTRERERVKERPLLGGKLMFGW